MNRLQTLIDRELIKNTFAAYVAGYNPDDPKIALKIAHTYRVAALCEEIALSLGLSDADTDLAWTIGMLHDTGRFEQVRIYHTFIDSLSESHARIGIRYLFTDNHITDYIPGITREISDIIYTAVDTHSDYRLPENLDDRQLMLCNILRDADKIDILKVNVEATMEAIYDVTTAELKASGITPEVFAAFREKHAVPRALKKEPLDHMAGHASLVFELVYPRSRSLALSQGYIFKLLSFESDNEETNKIIAEMRKAVTEFLEQE